MLAIALVPPGDFLRSSRASSLLQGIHAFHVDCLLVHVGSAKTSALLGGRRAFVAVPEVLLFDPLLENMSKTGMLPLIHFDSATEDKAPVIERMQALHQAGISLGLADARAVIDHPALGNAASLAFLPIDKIIPPDLLQLVRQFAAEYPKLQLAACGVETSEEFEVCRRLGMKYFIGSFVSHRKDWSNNKVDPGALRISGLLSRIRKGAELDVIAEEIKLDPMLSFRLLTYANSAAIGAERKIVAIKDAVILMGRDQLIRWLVLLLCASAPARPEHSLLLENALARGRMMELLAKEGTAPGLRENYFLTGLLSLLDVMLQLPATSLFAAIDLPDDVKAALAWVHETNQAMISRE